MLGKGYYHHEVRNGWLYDIDPMGKIVAWVNLSPGGGGGGSGNIPYSYAPVGNTHQGYSVAAHDFSSWHVGEFSSASWQGFSHSYNEYRSWSQTSYTTVIESSFSEYWGNWSSGPGYQSSFGHSESTWMRDVYNVSYNNGELTVGRYHYESTGISDYSSYRGGNVALENQSSHRSELTSVQETTISPEGMGTFNFLSLQEDSFDFSRMEIGNSVNVNQLETHSSFNLSEWASPHGEGYEVSQAYESFEHHAVFDEGMAFVQESSFQMQQVQSASQFLLM